MSVQDEMDAAVGAHEPGPAVNDDEANRLLRRLRVAERKRAEVVAVATAEIDRIAAWRDDRLGTLEAENEHLTSLLNGFMRAVFTSRHAKTLSLPNGTLRLRPPRGRLEVPNLGAFIAWADGREDYAELVDTKHTARRTAIRTLLTVGPVISAHEDIELLGFVDTNGEAVPGVVLERGTAQAFTIGLEEGPVEPRGDDDNEG